MRARRFGRREPSNGCVSRHVDSRFQYLTRRWLEPLEDRRMRTVFLVDSLADTVADDGAATLRESLQAANSNTPLWGGAVPAGRSTVADEIAFEASLRHGNRWIRKMLDADQTPDASRIFVHGDCPDFRDMGDGYAKDAAAAKMGLSPSARSCWITRGRGARGWGRATWPIATSGARRPINCWPTRRWTPGPIKRPARPTTSGGRWATT